MAAKQKQTFVEDYAFNEQLWWYYVNNRGKIRSRYNDLTKKFLAYNDKNENKDAFLRQPQFEALEMYVFIKEFLDNPVIERINIFYLSCGNFVFVKPDSFLWGIIDMFFDNGFEVV